MTKRFECFLDPCGHWTIWDSEADAPVGDGSRFPPTLTAREAEVLTALLNLMTPAIGDQDNRLSAGPPAGLSKPRS